jgi:EamA domain-containing membrane protein RarD
LLFGAIISSPCTVKSAIDVNDPAILSLILALGILTLISRLLSSWALAHGTMASMGALEYTTLFWALCFGFVLFEEVATIDMLVFGTFAAVLGILASRQSAIR